MDTNNETNGRGDAPNPDFADQGKGRKMDTEKAELRIVKREVPSRIRAFRLMPTDDRMLEDYARTHEATVSDIVISALRQTGVLPEAGE